MPGRGSKGPKAATCLVGSQDREEATVAGTDRAIGRGGLKVGRARSCRHHTPCTQKQLALFPPSGLEPGNGDGT
jgi:hypothetical protein